MALTEGALRLAVRLAVTRAWGLDPDAAGVAAVDAAGAAGLPGETPSFDDATWAEARAVGAGLADAIERRGDERTEIRVGRRDQGRFYTPDALVEALVDAAVAGGLDGPVLDPACGDARLLIGVGRVTGRRDALHGVDRDALTVEWARARLAIALSRAGERWGPGTRICCANALFGPIEAEVAPPEGAPDAIRWAEVFPEVFAAGGFAAVIANPPWIAHAGRAARPMAPEVRGWLLSDEPAFHGYRTTHGAFVGRAVRLVRPGGRVVLLLPTSVADLDGYAAVRRAVARHADVEAPLTTFAERSFDGVFQPSVRFVARRRAAGGDDARPWRLDTDGPPDALAGLPTLPPGLFVDVGIQTTPALREAFRDAPDAEATTPVRRGRDVVAWSAGPPRAWVDARRLGRRHAGGWGDVVGLVRQTARFPIAAPNDGAAFRNSLLGIRRDDAWPLPLVLALLNSATVRAWHQGRWRDAREGMPQVKVGHLRAIPAPPRLEAVRERLIRAAEARIQGEVAMEDEIDALVRAAYGLG